MHFAIIFVVYVQNKFFITNQPFSTIGPCSSMVIWSVRSDKWPSTLNDRFGSLHSRRFSRFSDSFFCLTKSHKLIFNIKYMQAEKFKLKISKYFYDSPSDTMLFSTVFLLNKLHSNNIQNYWSNTSKWNKICGISTTYLSKFICRITNFL